MSLTEEARAPFSLVDEINQVCRNPSHSTQSLTCITGHGPTRRTRGAQLNGQRNMSGRQRTILPHYSQAATGPELPREDEDPLC